MRGVESNSNNRNKVSLRPQGPSGSPNKFVPPHLRPNAHPPSFINRPASTGWIKFLLCPMCVDLLSLPTNQLPQKKNKFLQNGSDNWETTKQPFSNQ
ncbi:hypothetical protein Leryth_019817 [Lithospermum erythrorhizon]|nr:hypothetical protein Leryth_019817 [Lithospermum erythrorhizon]